MDVPHGGFDKLSTRNLSTSFEWQHTSEQVVNKVLEQCAVIMRMQHIAGSSKLYGVRMKRNGAEAPRAFHQDPTAIYATTSSETAIWV